MSSPIDAAGDRVAFTSSASNLLPGVTGTHAYVRDLATATTTLVDRTVKRVVERGKIITAAGVSAGIDIALTLAARIASDEVAQSIQLSIEYDPAPRFDAGSSQTAPAHVIELALEAQAARRRAAGVA